MSKRGSKVRKGKLVAFVAKITLKNGRVLHASDYGIKGFPLKRSA